VLKKPKNKLVGELDQLDKLAESRPLSAQERERRRELIIKLDETWKIEEISARSREREIKEGDHNIPFFCKSKPKEEEKIISCLEDNGVPLTENEDMLRHVVDFYKSLFSKEIRETISIGEEDEKVTKEENELLEEPFTEAEIKKAIDDSYAEGAPGPDGFSFLFYQKFWSLIKEDLMAMVRSFEKGEINIARLNFAMIIFIPKEDEARTLKKFMPISLINCSFKIFSKALNNRLEMLCDRLLAPNQTPFVRTDISLRVLYLPMRYCMML
jgi:hypothetical protein